MTILRIVTLYRAWFGISSDPYLRVLRANVLQIPNMTRWICRGRWHLTYVHLAADALLFNKNEGSPRDSRKIVEGTRSACVNAAE